MQIMAPTPLQCWGRKQLSAFLVSASMPGVLALQFILLPRTRPVKLATAAALQGLPSRQLYPTCCFLCNWPTGRRQLDYRRVQPQCLHLVLSGRSVLHPKLHCGRCVLGAMGAHLQPLQRYQCLVRALVLGLPGCTWPAHCRDRLTYITPLPDMCVWCPSAWRHKCCVLHYCLASVCKNCQRG